MLRVTGYELRVARLDILTFRPATRNAEPATRNPQHVILQLFNQ